MGGRKASHVVFPAQKGGCPISYPVLTTKLYLPPLRPNLVPRPRLVRRLEEGLQRPLTLISAPAGFGKTTLLSEWWAAQGAAAPLVAWLSLDASDNDPTRFWTYVLAALSRLPGMAGSFHETAEMLRSGQQAPPDELLTPLINELGSDGAPIVLVLDDYHVIEATAVHGAVSFLVEHLPGRLRVVVLTREDPRLQGPALAEYQPPMALPAGSGTAGARRAP